MKVAYIISRFPKLTETFVLDEMLEMERQGIEVEVYPLLRARETGVYIGGTSLFSKVLERLIPARERLLIHQEAQPLVARSHYTPMWSWPILRANVSFLISRPSSYLSALSRVLRAAWGSANYFIGALAIFPTCVFWADRMRADGIQHVHAHFANHPATAALVIHRLTGLSYSFTAHGSDLHIDQHMLRDKVREAGMVVTISNYNKELILSHCGAHFRDRVKVILVGVDIDVFVPANVLPTDDRAHCLNILCIGTLHEVKGQRYLIEACRLLRLRGLELQCKLVGDGPDRVQLDRQVQAAGLTGVVRFLGPRTRRQILELLHASDVLVAPSIPTKSGRREGIPVVLMEAQACGLPVVTSNISGIPEMIEAERNGLLVPPGDSLAIARSLERLAEAPDLRRRLGIAGREQVVLKFNLKRNVALLIEEFRQISNKSNTRPNLAIASAGR